MTLDRISLFFYGLVGPSLYINSVTYTCEERRVEFLDHQKLLQIFLNIHIFNIETQILKILQGLVLEPPANQNNPFQRDSLNTVLTCQQGSSSGR